MNRWILSSGLATGRPVSSGGTDARIYGELIADGLLLPVSIGACEQQTGGLLLVLQAQCMGAMPIGKRNKRRAAS